MHLASFKRGPKTTYGVRSGGGVIDVADLDLKGGLPLPPTLIELIRGGADAFDRLAAGVDGHRGLPIDGAALTFLPPIARPGKVLCLALNNSANVGRIISGPPNPAFFSKPSTALTGHGVAIPMRSFYGRVHPEPELAAVIGRDGKDIPAEQAYDHVFGYTIHNDITSPTMRGEDTYCYRAIHPDGANGVRHVDTNVSYPGRYKGADGFSPMGPWVATRDVVPDPHCLPIACWHNDELITSDNTANLTHHLPAVIAYISRFMTLEAGDIISLGTALSAAPGSGKAIQTIDLNQLGGTVSVAIEGIGTLVNGVSHE